MNKFEKYFEELKNIKGKVVIINDKPKECTLFTDCNDCIRKISNMSVLTGMCSSKRLIKWLAEEYVESVESVTLNKKERMFCELVETGYIARDKDGKIYWYKAIPNKRICDWYDSITQVHISFEFIDEYSENLKFDFIKWEDEKPWSVEDLLKLEVE